MNEEELLSILETRIATAQSEIARDASGIEHIDDLKADLDQALAAV